MVQPEHRTITMTENKRPWSPPQIIWSAIVAILVWSGVGFSWFGTGFGWRTQAVAMESTATALKEQLATICVAQARNSLNAETALKTMSELQSWKRGEFVKDEKWANMPGSDSPESGVATLCATKLGEE